MLCKILNFLSGWKSKQIDGFIDKLDTLKEKIFIYFRIRGLKTDFTI